MTNFAVQSIAGPVVGSLASRDKGSAGNRMNCAGSQIKNNVITMAQSGLVTGTAAGGLYAVAKNKGNVANTLAKCFDAGVNAFGKLIKRPDLLKKINSTQHGGNVKGKAAVLIAALALPILGYISSKHNYKMGQIDQQYTDKAKVEKTLA